jgi:hypothetical protein
MAELAMLDPRYGKERGAESDLGHSAGVPWLIIFLVIAVAALVGWAIVTLP